MPIARRNPSPINMDLLRCLRRRRGRCVSALSRTTSWLEKANVFVKVVVLSSLAYSLTNFRGNLLREMLANGHEVIAVAPDHDDAVARELSRSGVDYRVIPMQRAGTNPIADLRLFAAYVWLMLREQPQLVLAYTQKPIIYGGLAARFVAVPRFFALMSGLGHVFSPGSKTSSLLRWVTKRLYREAVRRARAIFVFNADDRQDMIGLGIIDARQKVIQVPGSGVDLAKFERQPLSQDGTSFLMIARLLRNKGIPEFLEASKRVSEQHPESRFLILGHVDDQNPEGITKAEIEQYGEQYPVEFIPGTADVRPYLAKSSVFVLPSYYREGLPRTILEAMAVGRPIITTDQPGCRDPIEEGQNGFIVPPRDARSLADAMGKLASDPMLVARMGRRSRELAEEIYSDAKVNRQLLDAMDLSALDPPRGPSSNRPSVDQSEPTARPGQPAIDLAANEGAAN